MGQYKEEYTKQQTGIYLRWEHVAIRENYVCDICRNLIQYDERFVYFEDGICGGCNHYSGKE
jgi:hypothetical protein